MARTHDADIAPTTEHSSKTVRGRVSKVSLVPKGSFEAQKSGYAPPEYRKKPWPKEALIEAWFPVVQGEQTGSRIE